VESLHKSANFDPTVGHRRGGAGGPRGRRPVTLAAMGAPSASLVGRAAELGELAGAIEADRPVVVAGEAGVGKTTLARAAAALAGRSLREGGALALLSWSPYLAVQRAVSRPLPPGDSAAVGRAVISAIGSDLLFLDDLQWADPGTLGLLPLLARRVGLLATIRTGPSAAEAALRAAAEAGFEVLSLQPLVSPDVEALVERLRPDLARSARASIARASGGNPFYVEELCRAGSPGHVLDASIASRLADLPEAMRDALTLLARAERPLSERAIGPAVASLVADGLAVKVPRGVVIRHELLGAAATAACDPARLAAIDRRLARISRRPGERARHHLRAGERALALRWARTAAAAAASPAERAAHLAVAVDAADGPDRLDLHLDWVEALIGDLDADRARAALSAVGDLPPRLGPRRAVIEAALASLSGLPKDERAAAERGLRLPGLDPVSEVRLRIHAARAASSVADWLPDALPMSASAMSRAEALGTSVAAARTALGHARFRAGLDGWEATLRSAIAEARTSGDRGAEREATDTLTFAILRDGRPVDALVLARELTERGRALGFGSWVFQGRWWQMGLSWHAGAFETAVDLGESLMDEPQWDGEFFYHVQPLIDLGRTDEAAVRAGRFLESEPPGEFRGGQALWLIGDTALVDGRWDEAHAAAARHAELHPQAQHRPFVAVVEAWAALELRRPLPSERGPTGLRLTEGAWPEIDGVTALAGGDHAAAAEAFDRAADLWDRRHARGMLRCRWAAAESLRRDGRGSEARERLLELEAEAARLSAAVLLPRVRRSLRQLGIRRSAPRRRSSERSALSSRETEILGLIADGRQDREIAQRLGISRWAIARAVESATAKLGVQTRVEAVARLAQ
jgi:DNA-binding CsgD family transcriptional regulator